MELRHLHYFLAVAEHLHFGRAAQQLHITQPPLSRQIRHLERELGVQLFERNARVELTEAGALLREHAERAVDAAESFERVARRIARHATNVLRVGYPATASGPVVSDVIREFESQSGDVELRLEAGGSYRHVRDVETGELDAAFVRASPDWCDGLATLSVQREPFVCVAHADDPLVRDVAVDRRRLGGSRLVLPSRDTEPGIFEYLTTELVHGLEPAPSVVLEAPTLESLYSTVAARLGIGIISQGRAALLPGDGIRCRPFADPVPATDLLAIWNPHHVGEPLGAFLEVVTAVSCRAQRHGRPGRTRTHDTAARPVSQRDVVLAHS